MLERPREARTRQFLARVIDAETGLLAGDWCPLTQREWFKPSDAPNQPCQEHFAPMDETIWADLEWEDDGQGGRASGRRNEPWTEDVRREVGRALRRIIRF